MGYGYNTFIQLLPPAALSRSPRQVRKAARDSAAPMPSPLPETPQELRWPQTEEMHQDHGKLKQSATKPNVVDLSMNNSSFIVICLVICTC